MQKQTPQVNSTVSTFLNEVFVNEDAGQIIFARKLGDQGFVRVGAFDNIADAEAAVTQPDLYLKINRMDVEKIKARSPSGIGGKKELTVVRAIGIDVDTAKKDPKYPPREDVLAALAVGITHDPSMIVSSDGTSDGGLHIYYILSDPVVIDNSVWECSVQYVNAIARQLREELQEILPEYTIDHCENIERLFRVAGSMRADGRRVEILECSGKRYNLEDLMLYPVEQGSDCIAQTERDQADSPISDYLKAIGIETVEDFLRDRMGWRQLDDTHWQRPDSVSGMPSGQIFQLPDGRWGLTVKTSSVPCLTHLQWYSLPALYTAIEFGGDWRRSASHARAKLSLLQNGQSASDVFTRTYTDFDRWQTNDRAAAAWCHEKLEGIVYVPDEKGWRSWNGSAWVKNDQEVLEKVQRLMIDVSMDHSRFAGVKDQGAKAKIEQAWTKFYRGYLNMKQFGGLKKTLESTICRMSSEFGEDVEVIHTPSYRIDLRTGERRRTTRDDWNIQTTSIDPAADAECDRWMQFLYEIMDGDLEMVAYLQRVAGYCLTGLTSEQVMFLFHGSGQNGKGVFTKTLEYVLGSYATILDQAALTGKPDQHPTAIAGLHRARLALSSETDIGCTLRESLVKWITSDDTITARRMREDYWTFKPTHKLILSTNIMPTIKGSDEGIWRRLRIIKFGVHFDNPDRLLETKLRMEAPGILNWMIQGARDYLARGLRDPESVLRAGRDLRQEMDIVGRWLEDNCELAKDWKVNSETGKYERDDAKISQDDFYTSVAILCDNFRDYCERSGYPRLSADSLGRRLAEKNLESDRKTKKRIRVWKGILLKSDF